MQDYYYYRSILKDQNFPLAYIDMDLLDKNIDDILSRNSTSKNIRIASKSIRSQDMLEYIIAKGDDIRGIMAYSGSEAVYLSQNGFDNILIAYPIVDKSVITDILEEIKKGNSIYFMVDSIQQVAILNKLALDHQITVPVCIDIDLSHKFAGIYFGVYRSPLNTMQKLIHLVEAIEDYSQIVIRGLMGYEAQIAGVPDSSPSRNFLLNFIVRQLKKRSIKKLRAFRKEAVSYLKDQGYHLDFVNGGGTGSVESTSQEDVVTEVTVGSGFYSPVLFDYYDDFHHLPAAGFAIQITRAPKSGIYTCHGGGYIASGAIGIDKQPKPFLPDDAELIPDEGAGEVQTPVKTKYKLSLGDPIFLRHGKAGELCEHFDELILIRDGSIAEKVPTYRGEGKNFL